MSSSSSSSSQAVDPTIIALYGEPPAGLDLDADPRAGNDAAVGALLLVATIALVLRLVCRRMNNNGFQSDDFSMVAALVFTYASGTLSFAAARYGAGKHVWSLTPAQVSMAGELNYIHGFIFAAAVTLTKISVLLLYARIFGLSHGNFRTNLWATGAVTIAYPLTVMVGLLVACQPISHYWTRLAGESEGRCIVNTDLFFVALAIANLVINVWILVIPIPQILKLQMSVRNKAAVCGLMLLGGFACVASIIRIYYLYVLGYSGEDVSWYMGPVGLWSSIEPSIGIWAACLSVIRPLYRKVWHRVKPSRAVRNQYINPSSAETVTFGTRRASDNPNTYTKYDDDAELSNLGQRWLGSNVVSNGASTEENVEWKGIMVRTEVRLERAED